MIRIFLPIFLSRTDQRYDVLLLEYHEALKDHLLLLQCRGK